jgi:hypothetical protein
LAACYDEKRANLRNFANGIAGRIQFIYADPVVYGCLDFADAQQMALENHYGAAWNLGRMETLGPINEPGQ